MIKQYFTQAIAQLKQHPLISFITIAGTALAIFLIMLEVMINQVSVVSFSPESNRDRFLHIQFFSIGNKAWGDTNSSNSPMSIKTAKELYKSLKTPEHVTAYTVFAQPMLVSVPGKSVINLDMRETDADYWKVFDFNFIDGKPYTEADLNAHLPLAVLTESSARKLFGTASGIVGKEFLFNYTPCKVSGVVKDVSTLADRAYGQIWVPYGALTAISKDVWNNDLMGYYSVTIMANSHQDLPKVKAECDRLLKAFNKSLDPTGYYVISRGRPYDQEKASVMVGGNNEPNMEQYHRRIYSIYLILLIIPAINLASMTHSRLRQRVIEIGVRRAFGSTKFQLINQIIMENLIVTLLAGIIGFAISMIFAWGFAEYFFSPAYSNITTTPTIDPSILFKPSIFAYALLFCFILNLLSCGIPAWRASRSNIVNALGGKIH